MDNKHETHGIKVVTSGTALFSFVFSPLMLAMGWFHAMDWLVGWLARYTGQQQMHHHHHHRHVFCFYYDYYLVSQIWYGIDISLTQTQTYEQTERQMEYRTVRTR